MKEKRRGMGMRLCMIQILLSCTISGCNDTSSKGTQVDETIIEVQEATENSQENAEEIIEICVDLYKEAAEQNKIADLERIRSIVNRLGENGYPAVDSRNQINMTESEKVVEFCEKVDTQEEAEITILEVGYLGGFVKYDLYTKDGNVDVVRSYYKYENGDMHREVTGSYQAEYWNYTEEGYLMFSGVWFSEELYSLTIKSAEEEAAEQWEKGYDLPIDEQEREEAETDCKKLMELYLDIYETADKGIASNVVLDDQTVLEMQKKLADAGCPVTTMVTYSNMGNYESVDAFLKECIEGKSGSVVIYEVHNDGGLGRMKFIFDGTDMYVVSARGIWNADNKPGISYISYTRLKEWKYTEKGWFCYELCVPEPPEVSEIMDGSCLIRVKPMTEGQREMSERLVLGLGYQGQNILCSNWNAENMSELDYNGMFEYLYGMKYGEKFNSEDYPNGIPKEEFENLIMEYLPVTAEQIREYAAFDEENQTYLWARLGCFNYAPTFFGTSLPEVVDIKENEDGTVTLTVEAVCDMVICDDAVITHELTVRFAEDGSFQYLGNEILNDGIMHIPDYQYRIKD